MISEIRARKIKNLKNIMVRIISAPFSWGAFWVIMIIMVLLIALYLYKRKHQKGPTITVKKVHSVLASDDGENYTRRKHEEFLRRGNYYAGADSLQNMFYVVEVIPEVPEDEFVTAQEEISISKRVEGSVTRGPVIEEAVIEEAPVSIYEYPRVPINWGDSIVEESVETITEEIQNSITEETQNSITEETDEEVDEAVIDASLFSDAHEAVKEASIIKDASLLSDAHEAVEAEEAEEAVEENESEEAAEENGAEGSFEVVEKEDVVGGLRRKVRIYNHPKEESEVVDGVELMDGNSFRSLFGAEYNEYEYNE
ncbi:hypothetical protein NEAUS03_2047 [Nematocida ausubeli]|nr:hypothetical protein NEAUS03_2047 [Nematocida ausubeli]